MQMPAGFRRGLAQLAITLLLVSGLPLGTVEAGLVPTDRVIADSFGVDAERARIEALLARDDVRRQLTALGVDPSEAEARIAALSDAEISRIAGELNELPAGEGFLTTIAIAAGVILIILVITDVAGITNVFTFIK